MCCLEASKRNTIFVLFERMRKISIEFEFYMENVFEFLLRGKKIVSKINKFFSFNRMHRQTHTHTHIRIQRCVIGENFHSQYSCIDDVGKYYE